MARSALTFHGLRSQDLLAVLQRLQIFLGADGSLQAQQGRHRTHGRQALARLVVLVHILLRLPKGLAIDDPGRVELTALFQQFDAVVEVLRGQHFLGALVLTGGAAALLGGNLRHGRGGLVCHMGILPFRGETGSSMMKVPLRMLSQSNRAAG